jgi:predicted nucleic acid-binding protein
VWAAPLLWQSELRNILATYLRQGHVTLKEAEDVLSAAEALLAGREVAVEGPAVLRLARASGRSAYDCEFVAAAEALGVPLVTADRQLLPSFPRIAVALETFAAGSEPE